MGLLFQNKLLIHFEVIALKLFHSWKYTISMITFKMENFEIYATQKHFRQIT